VDFSTVVLPIIFIGFVTDLSQHILVLLKVCRSILRLFVKWVSKQKIVSKNTKLPHEIGFKMYLEFFFLVDALGTIFCQAALQNFWRKYIEICLHKIFSVAWLEVVQEERVRASFSRFDINVLGAEIKSTKTQFVSPGSLLRN
jgi:hypothetical protein